MQGVQKSREFYTSIIKFKYISFLSVTVDVSGHNFVTGIHEKKQLLDRNAEDHRAIHVIKNIVN